MEYKFKVFPVEFYDAEYVERVIQEHFDELSAQGWTYKEMQATEKALFLVFERKKG